MSDANALQASYLLHYTPWRDTSFIVDLFTLGQGRLGLMAKGARGGKARTRALYQPFRPLLVSCHGDGELRTLTGIEESGPVVVLEGAALACGYYLNELVLRLLGKEQPAPTLFAHYALALAMLESGDGLETTLRTFELQLLETVGVLPDLARCTPDGTPIDAGRRYRFHPANALAVPIDGAGIDGVAERGLAIPKRPDAGRAGEYGVHADGVTLDEGVELGGQTLLDMAALTFEARTTRDEAKTLMRRLIAVQLGGKPLRSRSMFEALVPPPRLSKGSADGATDGAKDGATDEAADALASGASADAGESA